MRFLFDLIMKITYIFSKPKMNVDKEINTISGHLYLDNYARRLSSEWEYVSDGLRGVLNYIHVPPEASLLKKGDCDDFASHLYQIGKKYNPYLLTYFPKKLSKAHTVVVFALADEFMLVNWGKVSYHKNVYSLYQNLKEYCGSKIISFHWAVYNYDKKRFYSVNKPV